MAIRLARLLLVGLAPLALVGGIASAQEATPEPLSPVPAQYYELRGPGLLITVDAPTIPDVLPTLHIKYTYYPTPQPGEPPIDFPQLFTYDGPPEQMAAFPGEGGAGWLLTVTIESQPDLQSVTLTVLIPVVNLTAESETIDAVAIITTNPTSLGGPALVDGPLQFYQVVPVIGTVRAVGP